MFKDVTYDYIYGIRDRIVRHRYVRLILYLERERKDKEEWRSVKLYNLRFLYF